MFWSRESRKKNKIKKEQRKKVYDRVYSLHEKAEFLFYINDAYVEEYDGKVSVKLEGIVAKGMGCLEDTFLLFDCKGRQKAAITMEEMYCGSDCVKQLEGGDKRVALYPKEQDILYRAGDMLCKLEEQDI